MLRVGNSFILNIPNLCVNYGSIMNYLKIISQRGRNLQGTNAIISTSVRRLVQQGS
jgi:hypothetical protein